MFNKTVLLLCVCIAAILEVAYAHSWMQCTDYTEENGRFWDATKCRAWPRDYDRAFQYQNWVFGGDAGYNYQPNDNAPCRTKPTTGDYTTRYPQAKYAPGQRVCLAWPPKNHAATNCDNPNINDAGTQIYRSGLNPTSDPKLSEFKNNLVHDFGKNTGQNGNGFQNCPDFCANKDKALCTGCFNIPTDLAVGKYTFLWLWAFNGPDDKYTTCFDVEIVAQTTNKILTAYAKVSPDTYKDMKTKGTPDPLIDPAVVASTGTVVTPTAAPTASATSGTAPTAAPTAAATTTTTVAPTAAATSSTVTPTAAATSSTAPTTAPTAAATSGAAPTAVPTIAPTTPTAAPTTPAVIYSQVSYITNTEAKENGEHNAVVALSLIVAFMVVGIVVVVVVYAKTGSIFGYKLEKANTDHHYQAFRA